EYQGTKDHPFYSYDCGSSERLPNGNTLISESNAGKAFEVTPNGRIVWEFYTPHRAGENNELIANLFEVIRIGQEYNTGWLKTNPQGTEPIKN
ncbi:MAG: hypothetical protein GY940_18905, partial [bacterium]|nr:hypothetical protein [bacterium]